MVIEYVMLTNKEELVKEFVQAINKVYPILSSSEGHLFHKLIST
ncbi:hypothetical protein SAMN06272738_6015 [Bacillus sp. JKS001846]|nr:hypothetical protein SAMN06272738_6015 [Bacillus sp. JKS001846]